MDSRPFQIFEGSNEMLYNQTAEMITRAMKKQKQSNLFDFLAEFKITSQPVAYFKKELSFQLSENLSQRKMVDLGKILARVICVGYVLKLEEKGYRKDLVQNCITMVKQEVSALIASLQYENNVTAIDDYSNGSSWLDFA